MQNKVTVTIADREYTLVATEDAAYMEKVAKYVRSEEHTSELQSPS